MARNDGWHPLAAEDARNLTSMIAMFNSRSPSGSKRVHMTLYLWSRLWDGRDGVPYFSCGRKSVAKACGVSEKTVRAFLEAMERDGWIVRVGKARRGRYVRRTFAWLVCDDEHRWPLLGPPHGPNDLQKGPHKVAPEHREKGHHHITHCNSGGVTTNAAGAAVDATANGPADATGEVPNQATLVDPDDLGELTWA